MSINARIHGIATIKIYPITGKYIDFRDSNGNEVTVFVRSGTEARFREIFLNLADDLIYNLPENGVEYNV